MKSELDSRIPDIAHQSGDTAIARERDREQTRVVWQGRQAGAVIDHDDHEILPFLRQDRMDGRDQSFGPPVGGNDAGDRGGRYGSKLTAQPRDFFIFESA